MDLPFLLYGFGLAGAMVAASLTVTAFPNWQLARAALVVFANWVVGTIFALSTDITDGWWFSIAIDAVAAGVILYRFSNQWQVALGLTYCLQIAMHLAYGLLISAQAWPYYSALTAIAWLQLLLVAGWSGDIWLRRPAGEPDKRAPKGAERRS
jgi:NhaP-type Na+/H+ and K+/H+ antiporter